MPAHSILKPLCAQVLVVLAVLALMLWQRLGTILRKRINPQILADDARFDEVLKDVKDSSDCFSNQFEVPVLFYVAALVIHVAGLSDGPYVTLSWAFVASRAAHALVHCTSNHVLSRGAFYLVGVLAVAAIWARVGLQVLG